MQIQSNASTISTSVNTQPISTTMLDAPNEVFVNIIGHIFSNPLLSIGYTDSDAFHRVYITSKSLMNKIDKASNAIQNFDCDFLAKYIVRTPICMHKDPKNMFDIFCKHAPYTKKFNLFSTHSYQGYRFTPQFQQLVCTFSSLEHIGLNNLPINQTTLDILFEKNTNLQSIHIELINKIEKHGDLLLLTTRSRQYIYVKKQLYNCLTAIDIQFENVDDNSMLLTQELISTCPNLKKIIFDHQNSSTSTISRPLDLSKTTIETLNLINNYKNSIQVPLLPPTLKILHLTQFNTIEKLPDLFHTILEELHLCGCRQLKEISPLPPTLKILRLLELNTIHELPDLSYTKIEQLILHNCTNLQLLPSLPPTLKVLSFSSNHTELPSLSHTQLKTLDISFCYNLKKVPSLPSSIEVLALPSQIDELSDISHTKIKKIILQDFYKLTTISRMPSTLEICILPENICELFDLSNTQIKELDISSCTHLKIIPPLPSTLTVLKLSESVEEIVDISNTQIEVLDLSYCRNLKAFPLLPPTLKKLLLPLNWQKNDSRIPKDVIATFANENI